jgi:ATP-binding cassette subfamily C protein
LDNSGSIALNAAIKTMKEENRCVLVMAHRPAAIQECDYILMIDNGMRRAFGPKEEVLKAVLENKHDVLRSTGAGGVT